MSISQETEQPRLPAGWGWPGNSRKAHYFPEGDSMALCRKWGFYGGRREPDAGLRSPDDCVICRREFDKLVVGPLGDTP